jgi:hypothetical protein
MQMLHQPDLRRQGDNCSISCLFALAPGRKRSVQGYLIKFKGGRSTGTGKNYLTNAPFGISLAVFFGIKISVAVLATISMYCISKQQNATISFLNHHALG